MSSSKETYVIDRDDSDYSTKTFHLHSNRSKVSLRSISNKDSPRKNIKRLQSPIHKISRSVNTSLQHCSYIAQEIFTQTSKTLFELTQKETFVHNMTESNTLETQTSLVSIKENTKLGYTIKLTNNEYQNNKKEIEDSFKTNCNNANTFYDQAFNNIYSNCILNNSLEDKSSVLEDSRVEGNPSTQCYNNLDENIIKFITDESKSEDPFDEIYNEDTNEMPQGDLDLSKYDSDVENDSLNENDYQRHKNISPSDSIDSIPNSIYNDVDDLYNKLSINTVLQPPQMLEPGYKKYDVLTPLTEETSQKNNSLLDVTPSLQTLTKSNEDNNRYEFYLNSNNKISSEINENKLEREPGQLKLPPIHRNISCPNSPLVNLLFTFNTAENLRQKTNGRPGRWEIGTKDLASGENARNESSELARLKESTVTLPPIHMEGSYRTMFKSPELDSKPEVIFNGKSLIENTFDTISIKRRIQDLKRNNSKYRTKTPSRTGSPSSVSSPDEFNLGDAAERGCEALTGELLRRLRSCSWYEIAETLEYLPKSLENFWLLISENRIADLIRQVTGHIESPRTLVARTACTALAEILKNTNYTKKPDFYEGVAALLTKTSSFSRPVRRAANFALDAIVSNLELTHSVTAICIYGVDHKSPLVRCASARLLVVCCALAEGGRQLLRSRPPTAAAARRHTLRSLAQLLQDKNLDTRKYAERLYSILRPLPNFEAYFLTDVDVELATTHMKKYDHVSRQVR